MLDPHNVIFPESISHQNSNQSTVGVDSDTRNTRVLRLAVAMTTGWVSIQSIHLDTDHHQNTPFELLGRGATPQTSIPQPRLPRKKSSLTATRLGVLYRHDYLHKLYRSGRSTTGSATMAIWVE